MSQQSSGPSRQRGFVSSLFDFEFRHLVAPRIIRVLYILAVILAVLYAIFIFVAGIVTITQGGGAAVGGLLLAFVVAPLAFLIFAAYTRVLLEVALILFRIEENTRGASAGAAPSAPPPTAPPAPGVE